MDEKPSRAISRRSVWLVAGGAALGVVLLDQLTKVWAVTSLEGKPPVVLIGDWLGDGIGPLFELRVIRNSGAAFGLGAFGPASTLVLSLIAIAVVVVLIRFVSKISDLWWALALGLLLGGALGNLVDRLTRSPGVLRGRVVDFFALPNFPIFNVADVSLTIAVILILVMTFRGKGWS